MQQKTTPADRAQALLRRFTSLDNHHAHADSDGYYSANAPVGDLQVYVTILSEDDPALQVAVYDTSDEDRETLLNLQNVADDDLVASIIRQVIDQHNGKQVV